MRNRLRRVGWLLLVATALCTAKLGLMACSSDYEGDNPAPPGTVKDSGGVPDSPANNSLDSSSVLDADGVVEDPPPEAEEDAAASQGLCGSDAGLLVLQEHFDSFESIQDAGFNLIKSTPPALVGIDNSGSSNALRVTADGSQFAYFKRLSCDERGTIHCSFTVNAQKPSGVVIALFDMTGKITEDGVAEKDLAGISLRVKTDEALHYTTFRDGGSAKQTKPITLDPAKSQRIDVNATPTTFTVSIDGVSTGTITSQSNIRIDYIRAGIVYRSTAGTNAIVKLDDLTCE